MTKKSKQDEITILLTDILRSNPDLLNSLENKINIKKISADRISNKIPQLKYIKNEKECYTTPLLLLNSVIEILTEKCILVSKKGKKFEINWVKNYA